MSAIERMRAAYSVLAALPIGDRTNAQQTEALVLAAFIDGYESGLQDACDATQPGGER